MAAKRSFSIELLCIHHSITGFRSGTTEIDGVLLPKYFEKVQQRDTEDFHPIVATDDAKVIALVSVIDMDLDGDLDSDGQLVEGPCIFYAALAVDETRQGNLALLQALVEELERVRDRRYLGRQDYCGEIAAPLSGPPSLVKFLEAREFRRMQSDQAFWYRPRSQSGL